MDVLLRGLCELQIDEMLDESMIQEYSGLLVELGIPEEARSGFMMGYIAGRARSRLNASSLTIYNRPLKGEEIEVFSEVLGRRMDEILGKVLDQGIEKRVKEESGVEEPPPEGSDEGPLRSVATIGSLEVEEGKFSFKASGRKKSSPTILGIPVHT
jgi:hypothetical protein